MKRLLVFATVFIIAFLINLGITPLLIKLSHKYKWYDSIDERKIHPDYMPRIGGAGIFVGFAVAAFVYVVGCHICDIKELNDLSKYSHLLLVTGFFIISAMGLLDDFLNLRARIKFIIQIVAALCISMGGFKFDILSIPGTKIAFGLAPFASHALTILWIIAFCNAINLMDGMDGLAGCISIIGATFYVLIFYMTRNFTAMAITACLLGSIFAFLIFNYPPAKIYMGDSGSLLLGFSMAVIPLINNKPPVSSDVLLPSLLIFIIPIMDMMVAIIRRKRRHKPIFSPDREHLHHKLLDFGMSTRKALFIICTASIPAGICGVVFQLMNGSAAILFFLSVWILYVFLFTVLHYKNQARKNRQKRVFQGKNDRCDRF